MRISLSLSLSVSVWSNRDEKWWDCRVKGRTHTHPSADGRAVMEKELLRAENKKASKLNSGHFWGNSEREKTREKLDGSQQQQ